MPILDNPRHERFAQAIASGKPIGLAYSQIYKTARDSSNESASRLHHREEVSKRITEIKRNTAAREATKRSDLIAFLHQFITIEFSPDLIRPSDSIKAAELIAKMCGYNEPETVLLGPSDELTNVLIRLRNGSQTNVSKQQEQQQLHDD